jgi:YD repeat-containing protein
MATCSQTGGVRTSTNTASGDGRGVPLEIRQTVYFSDGSLDEYITSEWNPAYTHVINQRRYSASGTILEQIEYAYKGENVSVKVIRGPESSLKNRTLYQYNPQGRLSRESIVDNKSKEIWAYEYSYDDKGNRISRAIKDQTGNTLAETKYIFDSQGKITGSQSRDSAETIISSTEYQYDAQGNLIKQVVRNSEEKPITIINSQWQGGNVVINETTAGDGSLQIRVTNEYGNSGELLKKTSEDFQQRSKLVTRYDYFVRPVRR